MFGCVYPQYLRTEATHIHTCTALHICLVIYHYVHTFTAYKANCWKSAKLRFAIVEAQSSKIFKIFVSFCSFCSKSSEKDEAEAIMNCAAGALFLAVHFDRHLKMFRIAYILMLYVHRYIRAYIHTCMYVHLLMHTKRNVCGERTVRDEL